MEDEKHLHLIKVLTEDEVGLLNRVTGILLRRNINIEQLHSSRKPDTKINEMRIDVIVSTEQAEKIVKQLKKQIGIHDANSWPIGQSLS